ncbi:MAG: N-acetylglucosamine kinase [Bacteroidetes bacterium]|nr:N-acetylglucosamine kinase [Bacteroidota bacterium]
MSSVLLVESGSTKTDWCFLAKGKKPVNAKTSGINPWLQSDDTIASIILKELGWNSKKYPVSRIVYYGAGTGNPTNQTRLTKLLKKAFGVKDVAVYTDMMAAAHSLCGDGKGVVAILGTGSNCCYYNGKTIKQQLPSLGYIAGDEGGGNYLGKRVLQYYAYGTFDAELKAAFEQLYGNDIGKIINTLYKEPIPNRYLASFVKLLMQNRGHYMVENILEDCINDFFHHHILKYRESWKLPLYFSGSVAYEFSDIIRSLCQQYELEIGNIIKSPMEGLIAYHKKHL